MTRRGVTAAAAAAMLAAPPPALAHPGHAEHLGFAAGLLHPPTGADHLVAMVMVGLWAGVLGGRARRAVPGAFLAAMLAGLGLGAAGLALPGVEAGILASVVVLAALAVPAVPLPAVAAAGLAALAGLLHGHAHGAEGAAALAYAAGVLAATAALIGTGLALAAPAAPLARRIGARLGLRPA
jgi:urease accessory protein